MNSVGELTREEAVAKLAIALDENEQLARELKILREAVANLEAGLFGKKSERIDAAQLALFAQGLDQPAPPDADDDTDTVTVPEHKRKKKGHGRSAFPDHLPRQLVHLDLGDDDKCCPDCDATLRLIGEETCERGHIIPAQVVVFRYVKKKYACPNGHCVKTPDTPPSLIDRCKYEPSVYAHLVASKYMDHLPLHRLSGIFKRHGFHLPKQTMWEMLLRVYEVFAAPVLAQMRKEVLQEPILQGDDTPVTVRLERGKGTQQGRIWAWNTLHARKAIYVFTMTKERDGPVKFLGDWSGHLICDGASNFNEVIRNNEITRVGCWAHARRRVKAAMDQGSGVAVRLMIPIQRLFRLERAMKTRVEREGTGEEGLLALRRVIRDRRTRKLADQVFKIARAWIDHPTTLPKSLLGKALTYLLNQEDHLRRFLDDERLPGHNNDCERTLRHLAIGRKNWLVFGSARGGKVAAALYSIMLSCRALSIDPEAYLADALNRVATTPMSDIASLTPWAWADAHPEARVEPA